MHSSVTTLSQGGDQLEEQDKVTSPTFYHLRTLFHEEELFAFIPRGRITQDDQADNMLVLVTNTQSLEEQIQELKKGLAEKEAGIANLATCLENERHEKIMRLTVATQLSLCKISWS